MRTMLVFLAILSAFVLASTSFALRCGSSLASIGDIKHEVFLACGDPFSKEIIGYIDQERDGDRIRVMKIEEWIVQDSGYYYSLVFEGNTLVSIESAGGKSTVLKNK